MYAFVADVRAFSSRVSAVCSSLADSILLVNASSIVFIDDVITDISCDAAATWSVAVCFAALAISKPARAALRASVFDTNSAFTFDSAVTASSAAVVASSTANNAALDIAFIADDSSLAAAIASEAACVASAASVSAFNDVSIVVNSISLPSFSRLS